MQYARISQGSAEFYYCKIRDAAARYTTRPETHPFAVRLEEMLFNKAIHEILYSVDIRYTPLAK